MKKPSPKDLDVAAKMPEFPDLIEEESSSAAGERRKKSSRSRKRSASIAVKIPELIYKQFQAISLDQDTPLIWLLTRALNQWLQSYRLTRHDDILMLTRQMEEIKRKLLMVARIHLDIEPTSGKQLSEKSLMEVLRDTGNAHETKD